MTTGKLSVPIEKAIEFLNDEMTSSKTQIMSLKDGIVSMSVEMYEHIKQREQQLEKELQKAKEDLERKTQALYAIRSIAKDIPGKGTIQALYIIDAIDDVTKQWTVTEVNHGKNEE